MPNQRFVPNNDNEGGFGTTLKRWADFFLYKLNIKETIQMGLVDVSAQSHQEGKVMFDQDTHTLTIFNENSQMRLQLGHEQVVRVKNISGANIDNGEAVKITGADSGLPTIDLAKADTLENASLLGITTTNISNNTTGYVTVTGQINDVDTSAFSIGDKLFLSETTAGGFTTTSPSIEIFIGYVIVSDATNGAIAVNIGTPINAIGDMLKSIYDTNDDGIVDKTFSQGHEYSESNAESSTTSTALQDKATLTFTPPSTGDYILEWYYELTNSANNKSTRIVIDLDTNIQSDTEYTSNNTHPSYQSSSGFKKINLNNTSHTIKIQFSSPGESTAYIKNARILARRVH